MHPDDTTPAPAAAILADGGCDVDALLAQVAQRQQAAGRRLSGLLMQPRGPDRSCDIDMVLRDLHSGAAYTVSQPRGTAGSGCRADPQGFARASQVLRRALDDAPDLVISNRFGGLEALGQGFRAELLALLAQGQPLLTAVAPKHLADWRAFVGGPAELPAELPAIEAWIDAVLAARRLDV